MTTPNDDLDRLKTPNDILSRIEALESKVNNLQTSSVEADTGDEIFTDLGQIRMGDFLATQGDGDPDGANYTGCFMSANGFTINGETYHIGGMLDGVLMWAGNSSTGKFMFCGGNAWIDIDGITGTDLLKWLVKQTATNDIYTRTGKLGFALKEGGGVIPAWQMSYENDAGAELITNGDFETGDFTGWTKTTETNGAWIIEDDPSYVIAGAYSLGMDASDVNQSLLLTGDRVTGVADKSIIFTGSIKRDNVLSGTLLAKIEIKWYDAASGGALLQTDILGQINTVAAGVITNDYETTISAPTGALSFETLITLQKSILTGAVFFDSISAKEVTVNQKLWLGDDGVECSNGLYPTEVNLWGYDVTTLNSASAAVTTYYSVDTGQYFNQYTGISNANANDGDKYIWYNWLAKAGTYTLTFLGTSGTSRGKFDIYIDDVLVSASSIDTYTSGSVNNKVLTSASLDIAYNGIHTLELRVNGKHASSSDYSIFMTKINLKRTGD